VSVGANRQWFGRGDAFSFLEKDRDNVLRLELVERELSQIARPGATLLDVGAGDGRVSERFARLGFEVTAMDAAAENMDRLRARRLTAVQADATAAFPFEDAQFDVVFAGEIIEHLFDAQAFARELRRVLRPSGKLVLTTPNLAHLPDRLALLLGKAPAQVQPLHPFLRLHIRPFTFGTLRDTLESAGFAIDKQLSTLVVLRRDKRDPDRVRWALRSPARWFPSLGSFLIVVAEAS
jgi:SAM-dependent methyltransferase